jgi:hypothetical protein
VSVSRTSRVLFLHGGPGLTCQLERDQYGDALPVYRWDQPHFEAGQSGAFDLLVDAAVEGWLDCVVLKKDPCVLASWISDYRV